MVFRPPRRRPRWPVAAALTTFLALTAAPASASYLTPQPPFITLGPDAPAGSSVLAIINSGDVLDGFTFEGIPDGIGLMPRPDGTVEAFVNHEQSRVAFLAQADFIDSSVSRLTLDSSGGVVDASVAIPDSVGYIRFCSSFMAGPAEGFSSYTYFTNEESNDVLTVPPGAPYGPDPALDPNRQAGYVVVLDPATGEFTQVPGMGRHNHENSVVVPGGWNPIAILSSDDTFSAPASQLYMYLARNEQAIWSDTGTLWAFRVTHANGVPVNQTDAFNGANDYGDIALGDDFAGQFIKVPRQIAAGQTDVAPQTALEQWSNDNNVFQFIRVEDIAYDRNNPRVVYFADTGERRAIADPATGRLMRGSSSTNGPFPNGRIFQMVFKANNPRKVLSFSILLDNDLGGYSNLAVMHQPDNVDTSENSLMVQEDSSQAPFSRIWRYDFATETWSVVASVNDQGWESSGIVDASAWFGDGAWLVDVQAHNVFVATDTTTIPGTTIKREAGQLLLLTLPGT